MNMNLRDLQYLVTVAEHLHFGKAAELCHVSQPTLSMQLKKLEETLGVQLFERTNKQVMLTGIGKEITARARNILEETQQIQAMARAAKNPLSGEVRLGVFPTLAPYLLPELVPLLKAALPAIHLLLVEEKTPDILHKLEKGELDCALLALPVEHAALEYTELFVEPFYLAVPAGHRLAKRKRVNFADLTHEPMLLLDEGHCLREQALEVCHRIGTAEAQHFRATSLETLRHMVAAGGAVTLMPKLAIRRDETLIRYIPFAAPQPARRIALVWRKTSARKPLFEAMARLDFSALKIA